MVELYVTRVFIPRANNRGRLFPAILLQQTENEFRVKFGGLTVWGEVQGQWISPTGRVDVDTHSVYEIAHAGRERIWWDRLKQVLKERFDQDEVWILQSSSGWKVL